MAEGQKVKRTNN